MNARALAATVLQEIIYEHRSLTPTLIKNLTEKTDPKDQSLVQEICYGTLRFYHKLQAISLKLLDKPIKKKEGILNCLILLGLYQLLYMRVPEYAAVSETVNAAKSLKKNWATSFINKTLRLFIENRDKLLMEVDHTLESHYSHPSWLIEKIKVDWPNHWEQIIEANNNKPPLHLRVNTQRIAPDKFLNLLQESNISAEIIPNLQQGIIIHNPKPIEKIPGFVEGYFCVQDGSGQKVAEFLDLKPNQKILDACAAPGIKTSHILEINPKLNSLIAIDQDVTRFIKIKENINRLGLDHQKLHLILEDVAHIQQWWDGKQFDRILLDAPCSSSGVIRRHPDIKLLRTIADVEKLAQQQKYLINILWKTLAPKGKLIYTTCSIFKDENEAVIENFISHHRDAKIEFVDFEWGQKLNYGYQLLPKKDGMDGFYYSVIHKT